MGGDKLFNGIAENVLKKAVINCRLVNRCARKGTVMGRNTRTSGPILDPKKTGRSRTLGSTEPQRYGQSRTLGAEASRDEKTTQPTYKEWTKIRILQEVLKRISPMLGYIKVRDLSGGYRYKVLGTPFGDREVTAGKLLKEMENLALYYKIDVQELYRHYSKEAVKEPPRWLNREALEFCYRALSRQEKPGLYEFGDKITIPRNGKAGYNTNEQLIWVSRTKVEFFRYYPVDKKAYDKLPLPEIKYRAAMDYNRSMYDYIEKQKQSPSRAYEKLIILNRELEKVLLQGFFSGHNPLPSFIDI